MAEKNDYVLEEVKAKLEQLISSYEMCLEANAMLTTEIEKLRMQMDKRDAEYEKLKERFETLKIARSIGETTESKKEARAKINAIVREVDNCIASLNR